MKKSEIILLANIMVAEARGEGEAGMRAVAEVIMNRVRVPDYPDTIKDVIYQKNAFSCLLESETGPNKYYIITDNADAYFLKALRIALEVIQQKSDEYSIGHSIAYHAGLKPNDKYWNSLKLHASVGNHKFYEKT